MTVGIASAGQSLQVSCVSWPAVDVSGTAAAIARTQRSNVHLYQRADASHLTYDSTRTSLTGTLAQVSLDKQGGGITRFSTSAWYITPGFEINDLGFRTRSDEPARLPGWPFVPRSPSASCGVGS
ncbi:MAG: hypothetical protein HC938_17320 [Nitrospira sp.]|nr:hypothetical protein [Nitrospira sp.]